MVLNFPLKKWCWKTLIEQRRTIASAKKSCQVSKLICIIHTHWYVIQVKLTVLSLENDFILNIAENGKFFSF